MLYKWTEYWIPMSPPWPKSYCTSILIGNIHSIENKRNIEKRPNPNPTETYVNFTCIFHLPFTIRPFAIQRQNNSMFNDFEMEMYRTCMVNSETVERNLFQSARCCFLWRQFAIWCSSLVRTNAKFIAHFHTFSRWTKPETIKNLHIKIRSTKSQRAHQRQKLRR